MRSLSSEFLLHLFTELLHGSSLMVLQQATGASCRAQVIHDLVRPPNPSCQIRDGRAKQPGEKRRFGKFCEATGTRTAL